MIISLNRLTWMKLRRGLQASCYVINVLSWTTLACLLPTAYCVAESITAPVSYESGVAARLRQDYPAAEAIFQTLCAQSPENADYWFELGLVQRYQQNYAAAFASQQRAYALSPENVDVQLELARLYKNQQDYQTALEFTQRVLASAPDYEDAKNLQAQLERIKEGDDVLLWQVDTGLERSTLTRRNPSNWQAEFVQVGYHLTPEDFIHLRAERTRRLNRINMSYEVGINKVFSPSYTGYLAVGYTPDSVFMPRWRVRAGGEARLAGAESIFDDTWLTAAVQHDHYAGLTTTVLKPGVRVPVWEGVSLHIQHIHVVDEHEKHLRGWSGRVDWSPPEFDEIRLFAGLSKAPETENAVTVQTSGRFGGLSYRFTPKLTGHLAYAREDRENSFVRKILTTALSVKF